MKIKSLGRSIYLIVFLLLAAFILFFRSDAYGEERLKFIDKVNTVTAGDTLQVTVNRSDAIFTLSNDKAFVDSNGLIQTKKYGKVRITATSGGESVSYVLQIKPKAVIGIDPGHQQTGNYSTEPIGPGATQKKTAVAAGTSGVSTGKPEYKLTLEIAKKLKKELISRGYRVVLTRKKNNVNITNMERALLLNEECDCAIRLHADGIDNAAVTGAGALYPSTSNPYVGKLSDVSRNLSECVLNSYCEATGLRNRGLSLRDDLTGTNWSTIPVTLLEMGFMTNSSDDNFMSSVSGQEKMVKGIADGVDQFF